MAPATMSVGVISTTSSGRTSPGLTPARWRVAASAISAVTRGTEQRQGQLAAGGAPLDAQLAARDAIPEEAVIAVDRRAGAARRRRQGGGLGRLTLHRRGAELEDPEEHRAHELAVVGAEFVAKGDEVPGTKPCFLFLADRLDDAAA